MSAGCGEVLGRIASSDSNRVALAASQALRNMAMVPECRGPLVQQGAILALTKLTRGIMSGTREEMARSVRESELFQTACV